MEKFEAFILPEAREKSPENPKKSFFAAKNFVRWISTKIEIAWSAPSAITF